MSPRKFVVVTELGRVCISLRTGLLIVAVVFASFACAAKVQDSEMRAVWLPRESSHGLVVDEESSDVHRLYRPRSEKDPGPKSDDS